MNDRELLESLGATCTYAHFEHEDEGGDDCAPLGPCWGYCLVIQGKSTIKFDSPEEAWAQATALTSEEHFWVFMDDALAKRGWKTDLLHEYNEIETLFTFCASNGRGLYRDYGKTRNAAVREVYERIISEEQR